MKTRIAQTWDAVDNHQLERIARVLIVIVAVETFVYFTLRNIGVI